MKRNLKGFNEYLKPRVYWFIKNDGTSFIIALIILTILSIYLFVKESHILNWFDYTVLVTLILAICINFGSIFLSKVFARFIEDDIKLSSDYEALIKKYDANFVEENNSMLDGVALENFKRLIKITNGKYDNQQECAVKLPVVVTEHLYNKNIIIDDNKMENYELPIDITNETDHLFQAHSTSQVYNQLNIRIKDWKTDGKTFIIKTMRTTYFDSLLTNRAMDYKWENGMTVRDKYCYGPFIPELNESKLSNHLGFNGFVESSDGYIPLVIRGRNVSIAKNTYAPGIAASLKTKYALNNDREFTVENLQIAIIKEIKDELKIVEDELINFNLKENVIYAYRDLVEGGKPQLLIYAKSNKSKDEITERFKENIKSKKRIQNHKKHQEIRMLEDGTKIKWIDKRELKEIAFYNDCFIYEGIEHKMVPSALASVILLKRHLEVIGEI